MFLSLVTAGTIDSVDPAEYLIASGKTEMVTMAGAIYSDNSEMQRRGGLMPVIIPLMEIISCIL